MLREKWRRAVNAVALSLCGVLSAVALFPLLALVYHVTRQGARSLDIHFFTQLPKPLDYPEAGMANALVGSFILVGLAAAMGVPVGVTAGAFLARTVGGRLAFWVRYAADVLSGVPSIVVGVVVFELVVIPMKGFSAFSGSVALALIMLPTVVRTTEEMIRLVPLTLYEAALALGIPQWRATLTVLIKGARAGIITGIMLAAARVSGETAPLLFTAFSNQYWNFRLTEPMASLPVMIYNYALSPFEEWHRLAWGASLVLMVLILGLSILTRVVTRGRYEIIQ